MRDNWEAHKEAIASKIASLLGETYTLEVDMCAIFPYATYSYPQDRPGEMTRSYFENFVECLERYLKSTGDDGKASFNATVTARKITFEIDDTGKFSYCGCDIKDGRFRILSAENYLASNISDACREMIKAVEAAELAAGSTALSVGAKANVKETVDQKFPSLTTEYSDVLGTKIALDANLEANFNKLRGTSGYDDSRFGTVIVDYFEGFLNNLKSLKFKDDDMMQEAFQEACSKSTVRLEVVDSLKHGSYNDVIFEDGFCKIQVFPFGLTSLILSDGSRLLVDQYQRCRQECC